MKLLLKETLTYRTQLTANEVTIRLSNILEPEKLVRFGFFSPKPKKPYEDKITDNIFFMKKILGYRNSFQPLIFGRVSENFEGATIELIMKLSDFVTVFLYGWCGLAAFASIGFFIGGFKSPNLFVGAIIPLVMILFAYALARLSFKYAANESKKTLETLFEVTKIDYNS